MVEKYYRVAHPEQCLAWYECTAGYLGEGTPASNPGQAHTHTLVLAKPQLHVVAVRAAGRPLAADAPLAGLA